MDVDVTGHTDGTHTATGLDVVVTGGGTNEGLLLTVDDGGTDIKLMSSADTGDYFSIATTTAGATTITTVDDNAGAANLTFVVDGAVDVDANAGIIGNLTVTGTTTTVNTVTMNAQNAVIFEGATADAHETTLTIIDPTADRTINLPNQSGTIPVLAAASNTAITATPAELNYVDVTTLGTVQASKAVTADTNGDVTFPDGENLFIGTETLGTTFYLFKTTHSSKT